MPKRTLPGLDLEAFFDLGASPWNDEMDENLRKLSFIANRQVKSRTTSLPGSGTAGDIYIVPVGDPNEKDVAIWDGPVGSEAWVYYTPKDGWHFYVLDESINVQYAGTDWVEFAGGGGGSSAYDIQAAAGGGSPPAADEIITPVPIVRDVNFPADFAGSRGYIDPNHLPTGVTVIDVQDDGVSIGTVSIATDGSFTFATDGNTAKTVLDGSDLTFVWPNPSDATAANVTIVLKGSV